MNALAKAVRYCEMIATTSFHRGIEIKAGGGSLDLASSGGGFGAWQEQSKYQEHYSLFRGWLYSAIHAIASQGAQQPIVVARLKGKKQQKERRGSKQFHQMRMTKTIRSKAADAEFEILEDHPVRDLLEKPNSFQGRWQFAYSFLANICLTGWAYVIADVNKGKIELYCLPTTWVKAVHDPSPFSSFEVKNPKKHAAEPLLLKREHVAFAHLPNPSDPLSAMAPANSQMLAIRIDDHIQTSQEAFFGNGIFPSVIITVGKQPFSDSQGRPVLSGAQRRQLFGAVQRTWGGVQNYGRPAIVDGLIEKIDKLSATQNEMGWQRSEDKIRTRILSAFGVPPYVMGESVPGSYSQSYVTQEIFYDRINTYLDLFGSMMTNFLAGLFDDPGLLIWCEEKHPVDPSLRQTLLQSLRTSGDISRNEMRAEAGFPAVEEVEEVRRSALLDSVGGMTGTVSVMTALGQGMMEAESAANMLALFLQIPIATAKKIVGEGPPKPPEPAVPPEPETPPAAPPEEEEAMEEAVEELKKSMDLLRMTMSPIDAADAILEDVGCSH